jgi:2-polyprenyl-3-methyl-5-hydroxy-6-metoxy-1,4-benzoquinol methylase
MKPEWFKDWFNTPEYLNVYRHRNEEDAENHIKLILDNVLIKYKAKVLDMACGAGRHSIILAKKGFIVTAVDLSENLLAVGKEASQNAKLSINFIHSDIRNFNSHTKYDLVLNLFTSFGYFETDKENFFVLQKAYDLLNEGGYFILDYFNTEYLRSNLVEDSIEKIEGGKIIQRRNIENSRVIKKIIITKNHTTSEFTESVRMYNKDELVFELKKIGFEIQNSFGDFLGNEFESGKSPRLILVCKK